MGIATLHAEQLKLRLEDKKKIKKRKRKKGGKIKHTNQCVRERKRRREGKEF